MLGYHLTMPSLSVPASEVITGMTRLPLSAVLITKNEAGDIERCLRSLPFAGEIVVLDSGSSDGTQALARSLGATVIETDWPGFGQQKNRAIDAASHDWVFSIDADEWCDETLVRSIREVMAQVAAGQAVPAGFRCKRLNLFAGQEMRHGDWGRDKPLRLFRRSAGRFSEVVVHESVQVNGEVGELQGLLWHDSMANYAEASRKYALYAGLAAKEIGRQGKGGFLSALVHGLFAFLRGYVIRSGWLDRLGGLQLSWQVARYTFLKYFLATRYRAGKDLDTH